MKRITHLFPFAILVAALTILPACRKAPSGPQKLRVGYMQISECIPLFKEEIFAKHGLQLELKQSPGGAVILNSLLGGGIDIGFSNLVSPILARSQGADVVAFAGCSYEDKSHSGHALLVSPVSGLDNPQQLAGKQVALNTLKNIDHLMLLSFFRDQGMAEGSVRFLEIPFPRMAPVLQSGEVSAVAVVEPFLTMARSQGAKSLGNYYLTKGATRVEITSYLAKGDWLAKNRPVAEAFRAALNESIAYYTAHPDEYRAAIQKHTGLDKQITDKIELPAFSDMPTVQGIEYLIGRLKDEKFLEREVEAKSLIWQ